MTDPDRDLIEAARAALAREVEDLAGQESLRLAAARRRALAAPRRRLAPWTWGLGGLATAAAATLALMLWLGPAHRIAPFPPTDDLELLASAEVDLYAELDFYVWLAEQNRAG